MITLTDLCQELRNWFSRESEIGSFTISGGDIDVSQELEDGQYFRIIGSVFNDGVHKYPATDLKDETFNGAVWFMSVPPSVLELLEEMNAWSDKYADTLNSPFQSESFGGYSYTKAVGGSSGGSGDISWKSKYKDRLNRWRKI